MKKIIVKVSEQFSNISREMRLEGHFYTTVYYTYLLVLY